MYRQGRVYGIMNTLKSPKNECPYLARTTSGCSHCVEEGSTTLWVHSALLAQVPAAALHTLSAEAEGPELVDCSPSRSRSVAYTLDGPEAIGCRVHFPQGAHREPGSA